MSGLKLRDGMIAEIIVDIFGSMVSLPIETTAWSSDADESPAAGVAAVMNISGEAHRFVMVLRTSEALACRIYSSMAGEPPKAWSAEVSDAFGEVANMTAGNLKLAMCIPGLSLSIPSVIRGSFDWRAPGINIVHRESFISGGDRLLISVGESTT